MDEYGEEIYADLLQYYGVEVDKISPRRALALVRQLPTGARLVSKTSEAYFQWDRGATMMADLYDMMAHLVTIQARASDKKPKQVPDPVPYPRPGVASKKTKKKYNHLLSAVRGESVSNPFEEDSNIVRLK